MRPSLIPSGGSGNAYPLTQEERKRVPSGVQIRMYGGIQLITFAWLGQVVLADVQNRIRHEHVAHVIQFVRYRYHAGRRADCARRQRDD